jgi:hypothetical protein
MTLTEQPKYQFGQHVEAEGFDGTLMIIDFILIDEPGSDREPGYTTMDTNGEIKLVPAKSITKLVPESGIIVRREVGHD